MKLRWYQTYDENGVDSEMSLQFKEEGEWANWEDVEFVRIREPDEDENLEEVCRKYGGDCHMCSQSCNEDS